MGDTSLGTLKLIILCSVSQEIKQSEDKTSSKVKHAPFPSSVLKGHLSPIVAPLHLNAKTVINTTLNFFKLIF